MKLFTNITLNPYIVDRLVDIEDSVIFFWSRAAESWSEDDIEYEIKDENEVYTLKDYGMFAVDVRNLKLVRGKR